MTTREQRPGVIDLRARRGYRPDVVSLACSKVAAARERTRLSVAEFAGTLEQLLGWQPTPELVPHQATFALSTMRRSRSS